MVQEGIRAHHFVMAVQNCQGGTDHTRSKNTQAAQPVVCASDHCTAGGGSDTGGLFLSEEDQTGKRST